MSRTCAPVGVAGGSCNPDDEAMQRFLDDAGSMRSQFSVKDMLSGRITPISKNATSGPLGR